MLLVIFILLFSFTCSANQTFEILRTFQGVIIEHEIAGEKYVKFDNNAGRNFYCVVSSLKYFGMISWRYTKEYNRKMIIVVGIYCNSIEIPLFKYRNGAYQILDHSLLKIVLYFDKNRIIFFKDYMEKLCRCGIYVKVANVYHTKQKMLFVDNSENCPFEKKIRYPNANAISCNQPSYCDPKYTFFMQDNIKLNISAKENYFSSRVVRENFNWSCSISDVSCVSFERYSKMIPNFVISIILLFSVITFTASIYTLVMLVYQNYHGTPVYEGSLQKHASGSIKLSDKKSLTTIKTDLRSSLSDNSFTNSQIIKLIVPFQANEEINFEDAVKNVFLNTSKDAELEDLEILREWGPKLESINESNVSIDYATYRNNGSLICCKNVIDSSLMIRHGSFVASITKNIDSMIPAYNYSFGIVEHYIHGWETDVDISLVTDHMLYYVEYEKNIRFYLDQAFHNLVSKEFNNGSECNDFIDMVHYEFTKENFDILKNILPGTIFYGEDRIGYSYSLELIYEYILSCWHEYTEIPYFECQTILDESGIHVMHHNVLQIIDAHIIDWNMVKRSVCKKKPFSLSKHV